MDLASFDPKRVREEKDSEARRRTELFSFWCTEGRKGRGRDAKGQPEIQQRSGRFCLRVSLRT